MHYIIKFRKNQEKFEKSLEKLKLTVDKRKYMRYN
nr:MAG TPA: hypothetical protein [Caudoviricetes sp.]